MARTTKEAAAQERKAAVAAPHPNQKMLDALAAERAGYVKRGEKERVKLVDKQIAAYGGNPPRTANTPPTADTVGEQPAGAASAGEVGDAGDVGDEPTTTEKA